MALEASAMNKLKTYKFGDLYKMSSGISSTPDQAGHGTPFLSFGTVFNNYFLPTYLPDLMNISEKEMEIYSIKEGDIFLTRTSETLDELGMSSVAIQDYPGASYSGFLKRLRPTQNHITYPKFMAFYLRSKLFRKTMNNNAIMTLRASLNEQIFSYLDLLLPGYDEQKKIGDLLFQMNQKIELNNKINAELEAMAKLIYDYWFVQFDFPDENSRPYKSSGGKMVYNEELKREIPEGWEVNAVKEELGVQYGFPFSTDAFNEEGNGLPVVRIRDILTNTISLYSTEEVEEKYKLLRGDLLIGMDGNFHMNFWDKNDCYLNQRCVRIRKKNDSRVSLFQTLFSCQPYIIAREKNVSRTTVGHLSARDINELKVLVPNDQNLIERTKLFDDALNKIVAKRNENQKLAELRDWLLPMLMNGQVTVGEVKEYVQDQGASMAAEKGGVYD